MISMVLIMAVLNRIFMVYISFTIATCSTIICCDFYARGIYRGTSAFNQIFHLINTLKAAERNYPLLDLQLFFKPPYQCAFLTGLTFEVELNPHHVIILSNQVPDNIINAGHVALL